MSNPYKTGILLINVGTPDSYKTNDVRKYLKQFLNDPRVIDIPPLARSPKSAKLYKEIWTSEGSPLLFHSIRLKEELQKKIGNSYHVELAMRYGNPSIKSTLEKLKYLNLKKLILIPLYPQYSSSTTGSTIEECFNHLKKWPTFPSINIISSFYQNQSFIKAWQLKAKQYNLNEYDHVLFSYHGVPERHIKKCDSNGNYCLKNKNCCLNINNHNHQCYRASCFETSRQIAAGLNLPENRYSVTFQSRLGKDPWIQPYSDETIKELPKKGVKKLLVFSPAFVADCLETIHEIGIEYNHLFKKNGGEKLTFVESLNSSNFWVEALKEIIENNSSYAEVV
jgi:ferrochelatase